jgi:hypothetical protein
MVMHIHSAYWGVRRSEDGKLSVVAKVTLNHNSSITIPSVQRSAGLVLAYWFCIPIWHVVGLEVSTASSSARLKLTSKVSAYTTFFSIPSSA